MVLIANAFCEIPYRIYYIYFLITIWLHSDNKSEFNEKILNRYLNFLVMFISFLHLFVPNFIKTSPMLTLITKGDDITFAKYILIDKNLENKYLIFSNKSFVAYILKPYNKHFLFDYCKGGNFN